MLLGIQIKKNFNLKNIATCVERVISDVNGETMWQNMEGSDDDLKDFAYVGIKSVINYEHQIKLE